MYASHPQVSRTDVLTELEQLIAVAEKVGLKKTI